MSRTNNAKVDDWYVIDDVTGERVWGTETIVDYYGRRTLPKHADWAHPQWFIRPRNDPSPVPDPRPDTAITENSLAPLTVDQTNILVDTALYTVDATVYSTFVFVGNTNIVKNLNNPVARRLFGA